MQTQKWQFTIAELSYLIFIAIMTLAKGFGLYDGMALYKISLLAGAAFFALKLCLTEQSVYEWIWTLALLGLGVLIYHNSGETGALIYIAVIVGMKGVNLNRVLVLSLIIWSSTFVIQIITSLLGVRTDIFRVQEKLGLGHIIRWSLGAPHPNVLQITLIMICGLILYFVNAKGRKLLFIVGLMVVANLYIFMYSVSYTGIITAFFYLFVHIYLCMRKRLTVAEKAMVYLAFPTCVIFSIVGPLTYPSKFWEFCNKLFNTRFRLALNYLQNEPLTLFGARPSDRIGEAMRNLDCSYVYALMHYGVVLFALMVLVYLLYIHHCMKQNKYREIAMVLGMAVAAVAEPFFVNSSFKNITVFLVGAYLFSASEKYCKKYVGTLLSKQIKLTQLGNKRIESDITKIKSLASQTCVTFIENRKKILTSSLVVSVIAAIIFALCFDIPTCYYAKRSSTQILEKKWIYLDVENLPEDFEGKILNYGDADTPMQRFEGNIGKVEYVRGTISTGLWCGLGGMVICTFVAFVRNKDRKSKL